MTDRRNGYSREPIGGIELTDEVRTRLIEAPHELIELPNGGVLRVVYGRRRNGMQDDPLYTVFTRREIPFGDRLRIEEETATAATRADAIASLRGDVPRSIHRYEVLQRQKREDERQRRRVAREVEQQQRAVREAEILLFRSEISSGRRRPYGPWRLKAEDF